MLPLSCYDATVVAGLSSPGNSPNLPIKLSSEAYGQQLKVSIEATRPRRVRCDCASTVGPAPESACALCGREATTFRNLVDRHIKAGVATKKNPKQSTHLGSWEVCCLLGFWVGRQCRGNGMPPGPAQ